MKYPFDKLEVGYGFEVSARDAKKVQSSSQHAGRKLGRRFGQRQLDNGGYLFYRKPDEADLNSAVAYDIVKV